MTKLDNIQEARQIPIVDFSDINKVRNYFEKTLSDDYVINEQETYPHSRHFKVSLKTQFSDLGLDIGLLKIMTRSDGNAIVIFIECFVISPFVIKNSLELHNFIRLINHKADFFREAENFPALLRKEITEEFYSSHKIFCYFVTGGQTSILFKSEDDDIFMGGSFIINKNFTKFGLAVRPGFYDEYITGVRHSSQIDGNLVFDDVEEIKKIVRNYVETKSSKLQEAQKIPSFDLSTLDGIYRYLKYVLRNQNKYHVKLMRGTFSKGSSHIKIFLAENQKELLLILYNKKVVASNLKYSVTLREHLSNDIQTRRFLSTICSVLEKLEKIEKDHDEKLLSLSADIEEIGKRYGLNTDWQIGDAISVYDGEDIDNMYDPTVLVWIYEGSLNFNEIKFKVASQDVALPRLDARGPDEVLQIVKKTLEQRKDNLTESKKVRIYRGDFKDHLKIMIHIDKIISDRYETSFSGNYLRIKSRASSNIFLLHFDFRSNEQNKIVVWFLSSVIMELKSNQDLNRVLIKLIDILDKLERRVNQLVKVQRFVKQNISEHAEIVGGDSFSFVIDDFMNGDKYDLSVRINPLSDDLSLFFVKRAKYIDHFVKSKRTDFHSADDLIKHIADFYQNT